MNWKEIRKHKGEPIKIIFDDHALNLPSCVCTVYGFIDKIGVNHIKVIYWDVKTEEKIRKENIEFVTIIKKAVKKIIVLKSHLTFENN